MHIVLAFSRVPSRIILEIVRRLRQLFSPLFPNLQPQTPNPKPQTPNSRFIQPLALHGRPHPNPQHRTSDVGSVPGATATALLAPNSEPLTPTPKIQTLALSDPLLHTECFTLTLNTALSMVITYVHLYMHELHLWFSPQCEYAVSQHGPHQMVDRTSGVGGVPGAAAAVPVAGQLLHHRLVHRVAPGRNPPFFFTRVIDPGRSLSLQLSDA